MTLITKEPRIAARPPVLEDPPRSWSLEGEYEYWDGVHELRLPARVLGGRSVPEEAEFALVQEGPLLFFCYRFGDVIPWTAARCGESLDSATEANITPRSGPERRALLSVSFAPDGRGRGGSHRNYTLSLDFTRALNDAIRERAHAQVGPIEREKAFQKLTRRCPSIQVLVAQSRVRTIGRP